MTDTTASAGGSSDMPESRVTLNNFCRELSLTDKRVELIAAFHFDEKRAGTIMDTSSAYTERFVAFADKPVK